ncbi:unnamed protein product, partial [Amaranthus hypochondriacus]
MSGERGVHPDCRNASNPYHECVDFCFRVIAEAKARSAAQSNTEVSGVVRSRTKIDAALAKDDENADDNPVDDAQHADDNSPEVTIGADLSNLTGRQRKLFELRLKMNAAKKANQTAMVAEQKRMEPPTESRGVSKEKWLEERKKKVGRLLDANGLDMTKAYMLDTQEAAEAKYKKWEKDPAPAGWDVFNQRTLYNAY